MIHAPTAGIATLRPGFQLAYETLGEPTHPPVVLVMGLGMQLTAWPLGFCQALAQAGHWVVRFDNRDIGLSSGFDHEPVPSLALAAWRLAVGLPVRHRYTLADMADDTVQLMNHLKIDQAHLVGVSMGGMIAQVIAAAQPNRVASLTSIMSHSGNRRAARAKPQATRALLTKPDMSSVDSTVEHLVRILRVIGSPGFYQDEAELRAQLRVGCARSRRPTGAARQLMAILASGDRSAELARITAPTRVIHGADDVLIPLAGGMDTASKIPGASLRVVPGMGHDMPPGVQTLLLDEIIQHVARVRSGAEQPIRRAEHATT